MARSAWPVLGAYAAAFVGSLVAGETFVVAVASRRVGGDAAKLPEATRAFALSLGGLSGVAAIDAVVLGGVTLLAVGLTGDNVRGALRLGPSRASPAGIGAGIAGTAGLSLACGAAAELVHAGPGTVLAAISSALHGASPAGLAVAMVALCVLPAMAEEGLFRGLLQTRLAERWGRWPGLVLASMAFGLLHMDPVQGSIAFAVGLYLGWLSDRLGSIRPTVIAHGANNALFVAVAAAAPSAGSSSAVASAATCAAGLALCAGATWVLRGPVALSRPPRAS